MQASEGDRIVDLEGMQSRIRTTAAGRQLDDSMQMLACLAFADEGRTQGDIRVLRTILEHRGASGRRVIVLLATVRRHGLHTIGSTGATDKYPVAFDCHRRQEV